MNLDKKIHLSFVSIFLLFFFITPIIAVTCDIREQNCPAGQICDKNGECRECLTSAECWSKTLIRSTPIGGVSPWFSISILVLFVSLSAVAIFYMIAYLFQSDQYKRIAFAELMQVLASFLLVAFLFGFEIFQTDMLTRLENSSGAISAALVLQSKGVSSAALSGQIQINPFDISYAFLRNMISCVERKLTVAYENSKAIFTVININIETKIVATGKVIFTIPNPLALTTFSQIASEYEFQASELTWILIFLYAQIAVLKFIETSMFTVFLPIGLILRSFPPTRGAGAVLMAIAIGLYIVYPLTFTLLYVGTSKEIEGCNLEVAFDYTQLEKTCPLSIGATNQILASTSDLAATLDAAVPKLQAGVSSIRFAAFMYMLISLGVTFIFIRSLSGILGADISEIGRSMFRLL